MMIRSQLIAVWFPYFDLGCAAVAGALLYSMPQWGGWPLLLALLPWLLRWGWRKRPSRRTPYDGALLLFLATAVLSVWAAYDRPTALTKLWLLVGALLIFYAMANSLLDYPVMRQHLPWLLALFAALLALYFSATNDWHTTPAKITLVTRLGRAVQAPFPPMPFLHRLNANVVGGMLITVLPFTLLVTWQSVHSRRWLAVAAVALLLGLTLFALLLSTSRGSWLALLVALFWGGCWWLTGLFPDKRPLSRRALFLGSLLVAVCGGVGLFALAPERLLMLVERLPVLAGGQSRLDLFRNSLILAMDYPFIGAGLGGFMMLYSSYAYLLHVGFIAHAHNLYLDITIEQGVIALFALFWAWGIMGLWLWREAKDGQLRPLTVAAALSLTAIAVHGLLDDTLYGSRALLLLFIPLAFILPLPTWHGHAMVRWGGMVTAVILTALFLIYRLPLLSIYTSNLANVQQSRLELSRYSWPAWPLQDELRRQTDLSVPSANFEKALAYAPYNPSANRRLGQIELSLADYDSALTHLQTAYASTPWDNASRQLLGEALAVHGQTAAAAALWQTVNNAQGQLDARIFWYQHIDDAQRLEWVQTSKQQAFP